MAAAQQSAGTVDVASQRLETMIRDLVDTARLEAGELHFEREPVELAVFVADLLRHLSPMIDVRRVHVEASEPVVVNADASRLEQVLGNLLSNAFKYADPGTRITLQIRQDDGKAIVSVVDRGPGIAAEHLPHLFERGYRAPEVAVRARGLGLGLYIARLLVEAHHGQIWVESQVGKGSTFTVALPLAAP